jgi:hypothetical protein
MTLFLRKKLFKIIGNIQKNIYNIHVDIMPPLKVVFSYL